MFETHSGYFYLRFGDLEDWHAAHHAFKQAIPPYDRTWDADMHCWKVVATPGNETRLADLIYDFTAKLAIARRQLDLFG